MILMAQEDVDWEAIAKESRAVLDCANALKRRSSTLRRL